MSYIREALAAAEGALTRRAFFVQVIKGAGLVAAYDRFGENLFGAQPALEIVLQQSIPIVGALGRLVIPVDQDPGWATFEPDITQYTTDVYLREVFALGNDLVFNGLLQAIVAFNEVPPQIRYGPKFLDMTQEAQANYLTNVLIGNFENDGVQDVVGFGGIFMLLGVKQVFFQNFPRHLAVPNAEYQNTTGTGIRTGWDIMGFRGPVGPEEEKALRARAANAPELPGIDLRNPYI
jgi:hypothetical protein